MSAVGNRPAECRLQVGPCIVQVKMAAEGAQTVYIG